MVKTYGFYIHTYIFIFKLTLTSVKFGLLRIAFDLKVETKYSFYKSHIKSLLIFFLYNIYFVHI